LFAIDGFQSHDAQRVALDHALRGFAGVGGEGDARLGTLILPSPCEEEG